MKKKTSEKLNAFLYPNPLSTFVIYTGEPVSYRIRYRAFNKPTYRYEDVTGHDTEYIIYGLDPTTSYLFSIMARNMYGDSAYISESLKVTTGT